MSTPAEPDDAPAAGPEPHERQRSHSSSFIIVLTIFTSALALLLLGSFALYLTWQHPSLIGPIGVATALISVPLTAVSIVIASIKR